MKRPKKKGIIFILMKRTCKSLARQLKKHLTNCTEGEAPGGIEHGLQQRAKKSVCEDLKNIWVRGGEGQVLGQ